MTQSNYIQETLADGAGYYDWSTSGNWTLGAPQANTRLYLTSYAITSFDNLGTITLSELYFDKGNLLVGPGVLTLGELLLVPPSDPISFEAENGATVDIQFLSDPSSVATVVADAGSAIVLETYGAPTTIRGGFQIAGASGALAGGALTINAGYVFTGAIHLEAAGATLNLDNTSAAVAASGAGGVVNLAAASVTLSGGYNTVYFQSGDDDAANISGTDYEWDTVSGSNGTINLTTAQVSILGGGDAIIANAGSWASLYDTGGAADTFAGSGDQIILTNAHAAVAGGSDVVTFADADDIADLSGTSGNWDVVRGSNGTVNLTSAQAAVVGDDDIITANADCWASLYGATSAADSFSGSADHIILTGSHAAIAGGSNVIAFAGADDIADLSGANGNWDVVQGSNGTVNLTSAQAAVVGDGDTVNANAGCYVSLYGTANAADRFNGSGDNIILNDAYAIITGSADSIAATAGSFAYLETSDDGWDTVNGSNIRVWASSAGAGAPYGGHAAIVGGDDTVTVTQQSVVSLYDTGDSWDELDDSAGQIVLVDAKTTITGASDTIWEFGASAVSLTGTSGTWDTIYATGGEVDLVGGSAGEPLASIVGGDDTIVMTGTAYASLYQTGASPDIVTGSDDVVALTDAQASLTGSHDAVDFVGASALTVSGGSETFRFAAALGNAWITGFEASDSLHLSTADWASFAALQNSGDLTQVGDDTVIRLDGSNSITLTHVSASSLTASNFVFSSQPYGG